MTTEERTFNRQVDTDEHLDPAQDENSGEAAPGPAQRNEPAPDVDEAVGGARTGDTSEPEALG